MPAISQQPTSNAVTLQVTITGGDGQNTALVGASPDVTDVLFEFRVAPRPASGMFTFTTGSIITDRDPVDGYSPSPTMEADNHMGLIVRAEHVGSGVYRVRFRPNDWNSYR